MSRYIGRVCKHLRVVPALGSPYLLEDETTERKVGVLREFAEAPPLGSRLACVCNGVDLELPVCAYIRNGQPQVARRARQGSQHAFFCARYGVSAIDAASRGWDQEVLKKAGAAFVVRTKFSMLSADGIPEGSDTYYPVFRRTGEIILHPSATLSGIQGLLLEGGGRCLFPGFASDPVRETRDIRDAAMMLRFHRVPDTEYGAADRLLLPNVAGKDWTPNNWKSLQKAGRYRVFAVCDVSQVMLAARDGQIDLSHVFGVKVLLPERVLEHALARFPAGRAAIASGRRTQIFMLCTVTTPGGRQPRVATAALASLQALTAAGVPCYSSYECAFFQALEARGRRYRTFVRGDMAYMGKRPDAELLDAAETVFIEIFGFESQDYRAQIDARKAWYEEHFPGALFSWDPMTEPLEAALVRFDEFERAKLCSTAAPREVNRVTVGII